MGNLFSSPPTCVGGWCVTPRKRPPPTTQAVDTLNEALDRADAVRVARVAAGTWDGASPIFYGLLWQRPYSSSHLDVRMIQPENFEQLHLRHKQRDPAKGCIDPERIGTPEGRDIAEITLRLPDGEARVLPMFAYTAHLVPPDTLWDPEAGDGVEGDIYEHGTWTGTLLWDSAVHTAEWLLASAEWAAWLPGKSVLELGSGLGLPGLVCHALGASPVLLTDRPAIADLVEEGLKHNGLSASAAAATAGVRTCSFEWDEEGAAHVLAEQLGGRKPDVIIAADCIFSPLFGDTFLLLRMLDLLAGPHTTALVSLERRSGDGGPRFFECAREAGFDISPPRVVSDTHAVLLFELTRTKE